MTEPSPIIEIVLTGGPCGGKSSSLAYLTQKLTERGYRVLNVPESPTMVIQGGIHDIGELASLRDDRFFAVEKRMLALQRSHRRHWLALATDLHKITSQRTVILYDRAEADVCAYTGREMFSTLLKELDLTIHDARDSYDLVIHLVSAASGAEEYYTTENNPARWETPDQARAADRATLQAWYGHQRLRVIDNSTDFASKLDRVMAAVMTALGDPPIEVERKFLLRKMPDMIHLAEAVKVQIMQSYLLGEDPAREVRVRQRRQGEHTTYYRTEKRTLGPGKREEHERLISRREYDEMLSQADPSRKAVIKTRYCLHHGSSYLELDEFHSPEGLVMLEAELIHEREAVDLPPWVDVEREVTKDPAFANYNLAARGS